MADTTNPRVKEYVDYAARQVDEQAILDKYNAATLAQFAAQREQNRIAENQFYNQMYNTQKTAMDTIRQSNAAAVSSGASRGVQAANELSALLGLEQESVASATELAQANRQTAQEETAAVLENVLNAYQQASQERSQAVTQAIEAASLDAQETQANAQLITAYKDMYAQAIADGNTIIARAAKNKLLELTGNMTNQTNTNTNTNITSTTNQTNTDNTSTNALGLTLADLDANDGKGDMKKITDALRAAGFTPAFDSQLVDLTSTKTYTHDSAKINPDTDEAKDYLKAIREDAETGKIDVGSIIQLDYDWGKQAIYDASPQLYIYLGDTKFIPLKREGIGYDRLASANALGDYSLYLPENYTAQNVPNRTKYSEAKRYVIKKY